MPDGLDFDVCKDCGYPTNDCLCGGDLSGTLNSLVVPKALWDRMSAIVINVKNSPVRHAGTSCYDSGLFDKRTIDDLIDDIKGHNAKGDSTLESNVTEEKE